MIIQNISLKLNTERIGTLTLIAILSLVLTYFYSSDINLRIAYSGWGPQDYVNQKINFLIFQKDFLKGEIVKHYDRSLVMKFFYYVKILLNVSVDSFIYVYMYLQTYVFILALFLFLKELGRSTLEIFVFIIPIILSSGLAGADIGRFAFGWGSYLKYPLYYVWALSFFLFALTEAFKNKYNYMFLFLSFSIFSHVTMGVFGLFFIFSFLFVFSRECLRDKKNQVYVALFFIVVFVHLYLNIGISKDKLSSGTISTFEWVKMTKLFCYHWYPLVMKMFTRNTTEVVSVAGSLGLMLLSFLYPNKVCIRKIKKLFVGIIFCVFLIPIGIFFSEIKPIPFLIKLCLQRASSFASFFAIIIYLCFLVDWIRNRSFQLFNFVVSLACIYILLMPYDSRDILFQLFVLELTRFLFNNLNKFFKFQIHKKLVDRLKHLLSFRWVEYLCFGASWLILFLSLHAGTIRNFDRKKSEAYYYAQVWAKDNTNKFALFALDPSHSYAWKDFSQRSSYGTFRDWGFVSLSYSSNNELYLEGKRRAKIFGVDFDKITMEEIEEGNGPIYQKYCDIAQNTYYSWGADKAKEFMLKENIDYMVFHNEFFTHKEEFKESIVYSNDYFTVVSSKFMK